MICPILNWVLWPPELQVKMGRLKSQQSEERDIDDSTSDQEGDLKLPKKVA